MALRARRPSPICPAVARYHSVGPPDPRSNLRPVLYEDPALARSENTRLEHPYSLREFTKSKEDYQLKSERQRLDAFNHDFWVDSNTRFEAEKQKLLDELPEATDPEEREFALSVFYKDWLTREEDMQKEYTNAWRRQNWNEIVLTARVSYRDFKERWMRPFSSGSHESQSNA